MNAVSFQQKQPHSYCNQSEIEGRIAAAVCPTICIVCCQQFHLDLCAATSARSVLHSYMTPGTMSLQQTELYFSNHLSLDQSQVVGHTLQYSAVVQVQQMGAKIINHTVLQSTLSSSSCTRQKYFFREKKEENRRTANRNGGNGGHLKCETQFLS